MIRVSPTASLQLTVRTSVALTLRLFGIINTRQENGTYEDTVYERSFVISSGNADRDIRRQLFDRLPDGEIRYLTVISSTASIQRGQCYVRLEMVYGGNQTTAQLLRRGYVTSNAPLTWPYGDDEGATEGRGYLNLVNIAGAGTSPSVTLTVPTNALYYIRGVRLVFNTSSTPGDRIVSLAYQPTGSTMLDVRSKTIFQESMSNVSLYFSHLGQNKEDCGLPDSSLVSYEPIPDNMSMKASSTMLINLRPGAITTTDAFTTASVYVEEFIED